MTVGAAELGERGGKAVAEGLKKKKSKLKTEKHHTQ